MISNIQYLMDNKVSYFYYYQNILQSIYLLLCQEFCCMKIMIINSKLVRNLGIVSQNHLEYKFVSLSLKRLHISMGCCQTSNKDGFVKWGHVLQQNRFTICKFFIAVKQIEFRGNLKVSVLHAALRLVSYYRGVYKPSYSYPLACWYAFISLCMIVLSPGIARVTFLEGVGDLTSLIW